MPDFNITTPDGKKYKVTAPEGATQDQVLSYAQKHHESQSPAKPDLEPKFNALERGAADRMLGVEELVNNLGVGKHIGLPSNDILQGAQDISAEQSKSARQGEGMMSRAASTIGEFAGDPLSWAGGGELAGAKGAAQLAKVGGKYGAIAGATEPAKDLKENVKNTAVGGIAGAALTPAIPGAVKAAGRTAKLIGEGFSARGGDELAEAAQSIRTEADTHYKTMRDLRAGITPDAVTRLTKDVSAELDKTGLWNERLHGDTMDVLRDLQSASKKGISLESLDQHRRLLSAVINKNLRSNTEEVKKASAAIRAIDDVVDKLTPEDLTNKGKESVAALNNARATWSKARKFEMVADALEKSGGDPNRRKVLLGQLAENKNKTRGWTDAERKALKEAAANNTPEGLLKMAGKFGVTIGNTRAQGTGNVLPAVEMLAQGVKKGGKVVAVGTGAKYLQNKMGQAKAERLLKEIEKGGANAAKAIGAEEDPLARIPAQ